MPVGSDAVGVAIAAVASAGIKEWLVCSLLYNSAQRGGALTKAGASRVSCTFRLLFIERRQKRLPWAASLLEQHKVFFLAKRASVSETLARVLPRLFH